MTIERACTIVNSEGEKYIDLNNEKLSMMTNGIAKALSNPDLDDEKLKIYMDKRDAIKVILQAREDGSI